MLHPGLVEKAISPLLDWAEEVVPRQRWGSTPIFLFGTAGLRKLPEEHQENVLGTVRHILAACPFRCGIATPGVHLTQPSFRTELQMIHPSSQQRKPKMCHLQSAGPPPLTSIIIQTTDALFP